MRFPRSALFLLPACLFAADALASVPGIIITPKPTPVCAPQPLAYCEAADPSVEAPCGCAATLSQAVQDRSTGVVPGPVRPMYHVDTRGYPANLESTTDDNLVSQGGADDANAAATVFPVNTELSYESILLKNYAAFKGGSLLTKVPTGWSYKPHPWYADSRLVGGKSSMLASFDDNVMSCEEWVWKLWKPLSYTTDLAAACGADLECMYDALNGGIANPGNVEGSPARGSVSGIHPTFERSQTTFYLPFTPHHQPKNAFFAVSKNFTYDQSPLAAVLMSPSLPYCLTGMQGPQYYPPDVEWDSGDYWPSNPAYQTPAALAALSQLRGLLGSQSYGIGTGDAMQPNVIPYVSQAAFDYSMSGSKVRADNVPMSENEIKAMRERVHRLRELVDQYYAATTVSECGWSAQGRTWDQVMAVSNLQEQIVEMLINEAERPDGCLTRTRTDGFNYSACDWFAEERVGEIWNAFFKEREHDYQTCVRWTGNVIPAGSTVDSLNTYIANRVAAAQDALKKAPGIDASADPANTGGAIVGAPVSGRSAIGQVIAGGKYFGDPDWFGGGYSYGAYWKVTPTSFEAPPLSPGGPMGTCELDGELHGELHARVDLLKTVGDAFCSSFDSQLASLDAQRANYQAVDDALKAAVGVTDIVRGFCTARYRLKHLADATFTVTAVPSTNKYAGEAFFGGQQLWKGSASLPQAYHQAWEANKVRGDGVSQTIIVVVVPVTFQVYGEVHYGGSVDFEAQSVKSCQNPVLHVTGDFVPWTYVDAFASVAVGFSFAQAGIRGRLRVLDAQLPMHAKAEISSDDFLKAEANAHLDLGYLSGALSAFAEVHLGFINAEVEKEIFSWGGYKTAVPILDWKLDPIQLPVFDQTTWDNWKNQQQPMPSSPVSDAPSDSYDSGALSAGDMSP
jgi:hypothetical protein